MNQNLLLYFFLAISYVSISQNMDTGFYYLENGQYDAAKEFFEKVLKTYPENKTAKLCYARAIGLSGEPAKSIALFTTLREAYPNDFEIKLNYAESLLWNKQFKKAETFYEQLIIEDPNNFAGVLGYANTLSNLQKYPEALEWVHKARTILPDNVNALTSNKYIRLGYAYKLSQDKEYEMALALLDQNLQDFPDDKETLLNLATIYLITSDTQKARESYLGIARSPKDSIIALNGLSLVAHKESKNVKALKLATTALTKVAQFISENELQLSTQERYIQALLWNRKFNKAKTAILALKEKLPENQRILALEASYDMYLGNFSNSLNTYEKILHLDTKSFDGNLGIANAYRASGQDMKAYEYAFRTLEIFPKQPDAEKLIQSLKKQHTPFLEQKTAFTFDNGDNEAINTDLKIQFPISPKVILKSAYTYRTTKNKMTDLDARTHDVSVGLHYKFSNWLGADANIGVNNANAFTRNYSQMIGETKFTLKPYKLQNLELGYKRELQNFNADLIDREIVMNNYFLTYNLGTNIGLGWYTQAMYTSQSDENTRGLLFTSLYYTLLHHPVIKTGINYQYLSFKEQVPTIYFSPNTFDLFEVFLEIRNNQQSNWFYNLSTAIGRQFVENDPGSATFRAEGKFGHHFSERFTVNLFGKYSNIASATVAGFEFTEIGVKLKWYFLSKPVFNKKILELKKNNETK